MLARGIRSYHRPASLVQALELTGQGMVPLAGGTRLLASPVEISSVLELSSLGLSGIELRDGDLHIGALTTLAEIAESPLVAVATVGLLSDACRLHRASPMLRNAATLGGEAVYAAHDSEVVAALLALNAVFVIASRQGTVESPALRFLRSHTEDLAGGALVTSILIPGRPEGAAIERLAVVPSAPPVLAVVVTISVTRDDHCARARIALTGLETSPSRVLEAEARLEGSPGGEISLERCLEQIERRAPFRHDAHASAGYRRALARVLTRRAFERAVERARAHAPEADPPPEAPRVQSQSSLEYFTSGVIHLMLNGQRRQLHVEARTTLLQALREAGCYGVKHGCETGECGACAVLLDGRPVNACITLALSAQGRRVQTVEGLGTPDALHPVQRAFVETGAVQCGYCTPAMELCAKALLDATPTPTESDVREALAGCLCRCTGYVKPVQAVMQAARVLREQS